MRANGRLRRLPPGPDRHHRHAPAPRIVGHTRSRRRRSPSASSARMCASARRALSGSSSTSRRVQVEAMPRSVRELGGRGQLFDRSNGLTHAASALVLSPAIEFRRARARRSRPETGQRRARLTARVVAGRAIAARKSSRSALMMSGNRLSSETPSIGDVAKLPPQVVDDLVQRVATLVGVRIRPQQKEQALAGDASRAPPRPRRRAPQSTPLIRRSVAPPSSRSTRESAKGQKSKHGKDLGSCDRRVTEA